MIRTHVRAVHAHFHVFSTWRSKQNLHSHYNASPRCVEALRASWDAINSFHRGEERSVCLVSDVGGWIGRIWRARCVVQSSESFSVRTGFLCRSRHILDHEFGWQSNWKNRHSNVLHMLKEGPVAPLSTYPDDLSICFPIQLPAELVVPNVTAATQESGPHRKRFDTLHYTTSPPYLPNPSTNIRHQGDASLFASMERIDCIPRRAQGFYASGKDFVMRIQISIMHPKEDSVYCSDMRANRADMRANHAREPPFS